MDFGCGGMSLPVSVSVSVDTCVDRVMACMRSRPGGGVGPSAHSGILWEQTDVATGSEMRIGAESMDCGWMCDLRCCVSPFDVKCDN